MLHHHFLFPRSEYFLFAFPMTFPSLIQDSWSSLLPLCAVINDRHGHDSAVIHTHSFLAKTKGREEISRYNGQVGGTDARNVCRSVNSQAILYIALIPTKFVLLYIEDMGRSADVRTQ